MLATTFKSANVMLGLQRLLGVKPVLLRRNCHSLVDLISLQPSTSRYTICDTHELTARAHEVLASAPYILLDCEGHNSRAADGSQSLSLVQMGTPHAEDIFVFDMLALGKSSRAINSVLSLVSSPKNLKVGWGGVEDYASLARIYKSPITPFIDLQLVDIHSRIRRRESRAVQVSRLASDLFPKPAVEKLQIDGVHCLSRMDEALVEHRVSGAPLKENHKGRWSERPLLPSDIRYASNDIVRISELHNHFKNSGNLSVKLLTDVTAQTAVYMDLHGPSGILSLRKPFVPSNILPLDIINISVDNHSFFTRNRDLQQCKRCLRALSSDCFPFSDVGKIVDGKYIGDLNEKRLTTCKVCVFLIKKEQHIVQNATRKATSFAKKFLSKTEALMT